MAKEVTSDANVVDHGEGSAEASRALCVLRSDRQLSRDRAIPPRGYEAVVQVAKSAESAKELHVGRVRGIAKAIPVAGAASAGTSLLSSANERLRSRVR